MQTVAPDTKYRAYRLHASAVALLRDILLTMVGRHYTMLWDCINGISLKRPCCKWLISQAYIDYISFNAVGRRQPLLRNVIMQKCFETFNYFSSATICNWSYIYVMHAGVLLSQV